VIRAPWASYPGQHSGVREAYRSEDMTFFLSPLLQPVEENREQGSGRGPRAVRVLPSWSSWRGQRILLPVSSISRLQDFQTWPCSWRSASAAWPVFFPSVQTEKENLLTLKAQFCLGFASRETLLFLQPLSHNLKRIYCGDVSPWQITIFVSQSTNSAL